MASAELAAISSLRSAILFMAIKLPPINTGCVSITDAANMLRVSVWKASTMPAPTPSSIPARAAPNGCPICVSIWSASVPIFPMACFWSSLSIDTCLLVYTYAPVAFTCGKYLVRADFLMFRAISRFTLATPICLLFFSAIERQLSNDRILWAQASSEYEMPPNKKIKENIPLILNSSFFTLHSSLFILHSSFFTLHLEKEKLLFPIMCPSAKMLTI